MLRWLVCRKVLDRLKAADVAVQFTDFGTTAQCVLIRAAALLHLQEPERALASSIFRAIYPACDSQLEEHHAQSRSCRKPRAATVHWTYFGPPGHGHRLPCPAAPTNSRGIESEP